MKILVAEDDKYILEGLCEIFQSEGYESLKAQDGQEALKLYQQERPDFLCLDVMMPKINGYDVCREIRKHNAQIPILFISAKSEEIDRVLGLELGADDFITKPFGVREVTARIRAITRRYLHQSPPLSQPESFLIGDVLIFPKQLRGYRGTQDIELSLRDIKILTLFYQHKDQLVDRNLLLDQCWGINALPNSRTVDQHIAQLRKRIELDPKHPRIIITVHGAGYRYGGGAP